MSNEHTQQQADSLYIVMPAYNEEENIEEVVRAWYPLLKGKAQSSRLVVADAGSKDATHSILLSLQKELDQLEILEESAKEHGPKVIALYKYAIDHGADYIFQTDSDGQTNPDEFDPFWKERKKAGVILGNRTVRQDGKDRAMVEKVVCMLLHIYFGIRIPDANAPFRLMDGKVLSRYVDRLPALYNLPNIILSAYFTRFEPEVKFFPISFKPREKGVNSINLPKITRIGVQSLKDFASFRKDMKQLEKQKRDGA